MLLYIVGCEVNLSSVQNLHQAWSQTVNTRGAVAFSMGAYMYIHSYIYIYIYILYSAILYMYCVCIYVCVYVYI